MPQRTPVDPDAVARGQALFNDSQNVGCVSCHAGTLLTDNATVDVGTGGQFQVPSLRGVVWRAPYLHDGRAPTLADRFADSGGGDQHGLTSKLGADQISDLVAYLQTL
jgi:cytochrome c peroxidase